MDIFEKIVKGETILLVGPGILNLDEGISRYKGNLCSYLLTENTNAFINEMDNLFGIEVTLPDRVLKPDDFQFNHDWVEKAFANVLETNVIESGTINQKVVELIQTGYFKLILTTTWDHSIEAAFKEYTERTNQPLRVMSIYGTLNRGDDIGECERYTLQTPTLYYMLGKFNASSMKQSLAFYEDQHFETVKRWLSKDIVYIKEYIKNRDILAIGCDFQDWLFRFYWYALREEKLTDIQVKGNVHFSPKSASDCDSFNRFIKRAHISESLNSAQSTNNNDQTLDYFINPLLQKDDNGRLLLQVKEEEYLHSLSKNDGIFISYYSGDYMQVKEIVDYLTRNNFPVWFDKKELKSDDYKKKILDAINRCKVFMPIVSEKVFRHTMNEFHFYRDVEWEHANVISKIREKNEVITLTNLPVCIDSSPETAEYPVEKLRIIPITLTEKTIDCCDQEVQDRYEEIFRINSRNWYKEATDIRSELGDIFGIKGN